MSDINKSSIISPPPYNHNGFTLAEVLITLVVIGVIAAITVPTMIAKYQKEQTVTRLKKAYSALAQTTNRAISDYGPIQTWDPLKYGNANVTKNFLNKYVLRYLNIIQKPTTQNEGEWTNISYTYLNGNSFSFANRSAVKFSLADGTVIYSYSGQDNNGQEYVLFFNIDINGDKKPNKWGKDLFQLEYSIKHSDSFYNDLNIPKGSLNGKFIPEGYWYTRAQLLSNTNNSSDNLNSACNKTKGGSHCLALIMKDGWRIADDYPW